LHRTLIFIQNLLATDIKTSLLGALTLFATSNREQVGTKIESYALSSALSLTFSQLYTDQLRVSFNALAKNKPDQLF
jgi:hypothetical protein